MTKARTINRRHSAVPKQGAAETALPLDADIWAEVATVLELSPQQTRIVELLLRGRRDKQIARELQLTVPTVRTYLGRIFARLGVQDRIELILRVFTAAHSLGWCGACRRSR